MATSQSLGKSLARIERHLGKLWRSDKEATRFQGISLNELNMGRLSDLANALAVSMPSASSMVRKLEKKVIWSVKKARRMGALS